MVQTMKAPRALPCTARRAWAMLALVSVVGLLVAPNARSAPGLVVVPLPASGPALSYFKLAGAAGHAAQAGAIELRNPTNRRLRVRLDPVAGETISTLGSTYAPVGAPARAGGAVGWLRLGGRLITLSPGEGLNVPVSVVVPGVARSGDYLAGVSAEALNQQSQSVKRKGVSIASVVRYAIGVEISIPGPRHPLIQFTGARSRREPAGLTFLLDARNPGNVILQGVQGEALITQGSRIVAHVPLGPGTFVTGTSIAYPILTPRERPREGTVYRIRAFLRYAGGIARLDTRVRFGRAEALIQQAYGGPKARASSGLSAWIIALLAVLGCTLLAGVLAWYLLRGRRARERSPLHVLEAALRASREREQPLSLILLAPQPGDATPHRLAARLRTRLRRADRLCVLDGGRLLIVAQDTDLETARALASDLRRHLARSSNGAGGVEVEVQRPDHGATAAELLQRLRVAGATRVPTPSG